MFSKNAIIEMQKATTDFLKNLKTISIKEVDLLRDVLRFHEYRYYISNDPLVSDKEYDELFTVLQNLETKHPEVVTPDSPTQRVGNSLNGDFVTVEHLVPMLSLENSYNEQDLLDWDKRARGLVNTSKTEYSAEPKFDGASVSLIYEHDLLIRAATRGNGIAGDEITTNMRQLRSIPLSAKFSKYGIDKIEIRGEVLMTKETFKKYNEQLAQQNLAPLANPRNAASGTLRLKDPSMVRKRNLEVVLYNISFMVLQKNADKKITAATETHDGALQMLHDLGFKTPASSQKVFSSINQVIDYCNEFEQKRDTLPYEIDGMVIKVNSVELQQRMGFTTHHPRWAIAYKFAAKQGTSKLIKVDFQVGRTGSITPVAKIEPVSIAGATITSISLFNEDVVNEKDVRIGDTVLVERAGDVIPYIVKPLTDIRTGKEQKIKFPANCPVCNDPLVRPEGEAVSRCVNINCKAQVVERIIHFVSKDAMDIRSFGEANVRKFYELGLLKDVPGVYTLDYSALSALEGFGNKSIDNLNSAIEKSKSQPLHRLIFGLGIRYVGETTAKTLAKTVGHLRDLENYSVEDLRNLDDVGEKVAGSIYYFFHNKDNMAILSKLEELGLNFKGDKKAPVGGKLSGQNFLFTGTLPTLKRNDAEQMVEQNGGNIVSGVSSKLNYLVVGEDAGSKLAKAQKLKTINILDEAGFLQLLS